MNNIKSKLDNLYTQKGELVTNLELTQQQLSQVNQQIIKCINSENINKKKDSKELNKESKK